LPFKTHTVSVALENKELLHLLWALPLQALILWVYWRWRKRTLRQLGSPALADRLLLGFSSKRFWWKNVLFAAALAAIAVAIANPRRAEKNAPKARASADVLIALDISESMLARDVRPSRLELAKNFVQQLAEALEGERLGLVFFAGEAYAQMPLSSDVEALVLFARNATPDFITDQGSDLTAAVDLSARLFDSESEAGRAVILISDGEHHEADVLARAKKARTEDAVSIHTVCVGATGGASIPAGNGQKRDWQGKVVRTAANPSLLRELARAGGGVAVAADDPTAIRDLVREISRLRKDTVEAKARTVWVSYYWWLALAALFFLILEQLLWWRKP
jgi:Ca-activated chloride channel homolog